MLGVVKGVMVTALGIGGIGGAIYGITKAVASSSTSKPVKKELSSSGPVLVCGESGGPSYEIDLELDGNEVNFRVWKVDNTVSPARKQITLGSVSEVYQLLLSRHRDTKISQIKLNTLVDVGAQRIGKTINCSVTQIDSVNDHTGSLAQNDIDIQHTVLITKSCRQSLDKPNQKECEIQFREEDHLKWSDNFKPKIIYTTT